MKTPLEWMRHFDSIDFYYGKSIRLTISDVKDIQDDARSELLNDIDYYKELSNLNQKYEKKNTMRRS